MAYLNILSTSSNHVVAFCPVAYCHFSVYPGKSPGWKRILMNFSGFWYQQFLYIFISLT